MTVSNGLETDPRDGAPWAKIDRQTSAADQVYAHLREAIITCRLAPNVAVSENRICGMFDVSRSPVRVALTRLAEDGLIQIYPQRGSFVAPINLEQVREGQFARVALEAALLEKAAANWSKTWSAQARRQIRRQRQHAASRDTWSFYLDNEEFHRMFAECAGLAGVWKTVQSVKTLLDRIGHLANPVPGHMQRIIAEHSAIIERLDAGETAEAVVAMRLHINSVDATIARLRPLFGSYFID